jgi:hypothetical protein
MKNSLTCQISYKKDNSTQEQGVLSTGTLLDTICKLTPNLEEELKSKKEDAL